MYAAHFRRAASPEATRRHRAAQHRNEAVQLDAKLDIGERMNAFLEKEYGEVRAEACRNYVLKVLSADRGAEIPDSCMPYGFFRRFQVEVLKKAFLDRDRVKLRRCFVKYIKQKLGGAACLTRVALRGGRKGTSMRDSGASRNAVKGMGLAFALLQWFVDELGAIKTRSDSSLLLRKAQEMKDFLINVEKVDPNELPILEEGAGRMWLTRFRRFYNISKRHHWNRLKVSWQKIKDAASFC